MSKTNYNYIQFANYKDIPNWSVQYVVEEQLGFTKKYPMAKIGSFLKRSKNLVEIQDNVEYKRVSISTIGKGVTVRDTKKGINIGTKKQYIIRKGQFLVSKIDARNGAFGVVPEEADGAIITGNFWAFDVDFNKIAPQYLVLVTQTNQFVSFVEKCSNGTTNRHYLQEDAFLQQAIPLPSLEEQRKILGTYNVGVDKAHELLEETFNSINEINCYLEKKLQFSCRKNYIHNGLNFIYFKNADRWDVQYFSTKRTVDSLYEVKNVGQCISLFMTDIDQSSLRIETYKRPKDSFVYIGMESVEKNTGELLNVPIVHGFEIKSQTIRVPRNFFIYGKLRPYLNKYWVNNSDMDNVVCSSEFFCFKPKDFVDEDYFKIILSSYVIQDQISELVSGARMPRLNEESFKQVVIPIPPRAIQEEIAANVVKIKSRIRKQRKIAEELIGSATEKFEQTIFE